MVGFATGDSNWVGSWDWFWPTTCKTLSFSDIRARGLGYEVFETLCMRRRIGEHELHNLSSKEPK